MGKLYFKYGTMGAAKTAEALICKYRYEETGQKVLLLKTDTATRDGSGIIKSRIGLSSEAKSLSGFLNDPVMRKADSLPVDVIIVDECQFATESQIDMLAQIADRTNTPVICYGLKTDYNRKLFEGSKRLLEIADSITEIKSVCSCGRKAIFNIKVSGDDINGKYVSCCRKCADIIDGYKCLFNTPEDIYERVVTEDMDYYSPDTGYYVFHYNNHDAVCAYCLTEEQAKQIANRAEATGEFWSGLLGPGGIIYDDPFEFFNVHYMDRWIKCSDYLDYLRVK